MASSKNMNATPVKPVLPNKLVGYWPSVLVDMLLPKSILNAFFCFEDCQTFHNIVVV